MQIQTPLGSSIFQYNAITLTEIPYVDRTKFIIFTMENLGLTIDDNIDDRCDDFISILLSQNL